MRSTALALSVGLSLCMLAAAAPFQQESVEQHNCIEGCLKKQEDCLLESISMSGCVIAFDNCHNKCFPEETTPPPTTEAPKTPPATQHQQNQPAPNTSNTEKHKDVTHETEVTRKTDGNKGHNNGDDEDDDDDDDDDDDGIEDEDSDEHPKNTGDNEGEDGYDDDNSGY